MIDGNTLLSQMNCSRGAPMGRCDIKDDPKAKVLLFLVRLEDGGCYDVGGAYWGIGKEPLYGAIGDDFQCFVRAKDIEQARKDILKRFPDLTIETNEVNEDFVDGYIRAALWSTLDDPEHKEGRGENLDDTFERCDVSQETVDKVVEDSKAFLAKCGHLITAENCRERGNVFSQAGYDFLMTRNGTGVGFLDHWETPAAEFMDKVADEFGQDDWYAGDDKKVYN